MKTALLLIDVQESFRQRPYWSTAELPAFLDATRRLIEGAQAQGLPIVRVFHNDGPETTDNAFALASGLVRPLEELPALQPALEVVKHRHSALAGTAAVSGSTRIGAHCTMAGGAGVVGHVTLADHVHLGARSVATHSIHKPGLYTGLFPIDDNAAWEKNAATLRQLHRLRERIRALEKSNENKSS